MNPREIIGTCLAVAVAVSLCVFLFQLAQAATTGAAC